MARLKKSNRDAARVDLAAGVDPEEVMKKHGVRSRRTIDGWIAEAKTNEAKTGAPVEPSPTETGGPDPDAPDAAVHMGEAEMLLAVLRFGCAFTTRSAAMCVGFAPTAPLVTQLSDLTADEEAMVRSCAPSLTPAFHKFLKWIDKHGVAVMCVMFGGMMLPRLVTLGMAAKKIRAMQKAAEDHANASAPKRPETGAPPNRPAPNRLGSLTLYPKDENGGAT